MVVSEKLITTKKHPKKMNTLPDKTMLMKDVLPTYFYVGARINLVVNDPMRVFEVCMNTSVDDMKDVVYGKKRLGDSDTAMLTQATHYLSSKRCV